MGSQGKLVLVATPIGNLEDITLRALHALEQADVVCAEDTRVTGKLLAAHGIKKRLERLDEAMISAKTDDIVERLQAGEVIAFCSDAGMPGVSDPGMRLVSAARAAGVDVEVLPGPVAAATAYVASASAYTQFYFGGFFPRQTSAQIAQLTSLQNLRAALIFYESPHRVVAALQTIAEVFPLRRVSVCRELTKLHEEIATDYAPALYEQFARRAQEGAIKGEIVLVIDGPTDEEDARTQDDARARARTRAQELHAQGEYSHKDIVRLLRKEFGISRNDAYALAHDCDGNA